MTSRGIAFCSAVERAVFSAADAPSSAELFVAADALDADDMRAIGGVLAERLAAGDAFAITWPLLANAHEDTFANLARVARRRLAELGRDDQAEQVLEDLAWQGPDLVPSATQEAARRPSPAPIHLVPPPGHIKVRHGVPTPTWLGRRGGRIGAARVGGHGRARCARCAELLHRLVHLPIVPPALGVSLPSMSIETCLSCLGWEEQELWFRHRGVDVEPLDPAEATPNPPEFPTGPLAACDVELVDFGPRFARQDWGNSNGFHNLNRFGGAPSWVQDAQDLDCRGCGAPMMHLLQLDSCFPLEDGNDFLFGSGGLAYVQWCDACHISAHFWQCT